MSNLLLYSLSGLLYKVNVVLVRSLSLVISVSLPQGLACACVYISRGFVVLSEGGHTGYAFFFCRHKDRSNG